MNPKVSYSILSIICILLLIFPYFFLEIPQGQEFNIFRMFKLLIAAGGGLLVGGAVSMGVGMVGKGLVMTPTTGIVMGIGLLSIATISILIKPKIEDLQSKIPQEEQKILAKIKSETETQNAILASKNVAKPTDIIEKNANKVEKENISNSDSFVIQNQANNQSNSIEPKVEVTKDKNEVISENKNTEIENDNPTKVIDEKTVASVEKNEKTNEIPAIVEKRTRISIRENPWKVMLIVKDDVKYEINQVNNIYGITKPRASDIQYGSNMYNVIKDEGQNVVNVSAVERMLANNIGVQKISYWKQGRNTVYLIVRKIPQGFANEYIVFREHKGECVGGLRVFSPKIYLNLEKALKVIEEHEFDIKYF